MQRHDMAYERMAKVRAQRQLDRQASRGSRTPLDGIQGRLANTADTVLSMPEQFKSPWLRGLIGMGKWLEEMAEACSDLSGMVERAIRNASSAGNKADLALVIASGAARACTGQLNWAGFAPHKAAGAGLYALSTLCSGLAVLLSKTSLGAQRSPAEFERATRDSAFDKSIYQAVGRQLQAAKQRFLGEAIETLNGKQGKPAAWAKVCCLHLSRKHNLHERTDHRDRKAHCDYMWRHLHQYGGVTRALVNAAHLTFQGVNKLMGSYDKYLGHFIGQKILARFLGSLLGTRLAMTLTVGSAAAISVPMAPLLVGISAASACACGLSLLLLLAAKASVVYGGTWRGDIAPPMAA
ncbi:MAG TPA: hypothetical protein VFV43_09890 [Limnobacter sp.]|nr:hypothetical protein [Limnobacter sp.]